MQEDEVIARLRALWYSLNRRCSQSSRVELRTYIDCQNNFHNFEHFKTWAELQHGCMNKESNGKYWSLDKDIIVPHNKVYAPERCCFVPTRLNTLLLRHDSGRGEYPLGVYFDYSRGLYKSVIRVGEGSPKTLGRFSCPKEAHREWQRAKIAQIRQRALEFSDLPYKIIEGLYKHMEIIEGDYTNNVETVVF